jgi:hypothetical protein
MVHRCPGRWQTLQCCNIAILVGVVCSGTQRYVDQGSGTMPALAAEAYTAVKAPTKITSARHPGDRWTRQQSARDWLDTLTAPESGEQCPARTTTRGTRRRGRPLRPSEGRRCRRWCACRPTCLRGSLHLSACVSSTRVQMNIISKND